LVALAKSRTRYLKTIDTHQPIDLTPRIIQPLIREVAEKIDDSNPPGWRTLCREYRKWLATGRDIRAIIPRYHERGKRGSRMVPEAKAITDQVLDQLYMTPERKCVPEVHLEVIRRLEELNQFRPQAERLAIPSRRTIYREIDRRSPYEVMVARFGNAAPRWRAESQAPGPTLSVPFSAS
jgi:putative transposase